MKRKFVTGILAGIGACMLFSGCGKKEEEQPPEYETVTDDASTEPETETKVSEPEDTHKGEAKNPLTGEWIDEAIAKQRPVSCMIGNTESALPQFGISQADVIYEAPVEGGLTRLMGIFQDYKPLEKLGSVRSSRLYYAYYSMGFDAIYLHYGQASYASSFLESGQIDDLNGLEYKVDKAVMYRDTAKSAPHNAYATGDGLTAGIELKQYNTEYSEDYVSPYQFAEDDAPVELSGSTCRDAGVVQTGSQSNQPYFEYNSEDGLYYRYQYGGRHIDGTNGDQLAVKNIILQNSNVRTLDDSGYLEIDVAGEGSGQYITDGKAIDITWKCEDNFSPAHYYDSSGNEITLNQGKTWVCIIDNSRLDQVHFYKNASDENASDENASGENVSDEDASDENTSQIQQ